MLRPLLRPQPHQFLSPPSLHPSSPLSLTLTTRAFSLSTPRPKRVRLTYDLHSPPPAAKEKVEKEGNDAPIIFIHGLFGSKKNNRSMSKVLAKELGRKVYAIDLRNHGDAPHDPVHDYVHLADDVEGFMEEHEIEKPTLIGHSMGAKTAMTVALTSPSKVGSIVSVDNAPVDAALKSDFGKYIQGMRKVEDAQVTKQSEADEILQDFAPELPIRQFLLTNLHRPASTPPTTPLVFRIPIRFLAAALDNMADFPFKDPDATRFSQPALFVRGTRSHYVPDETIPIIGRFFPRFEISDVEAGHWVVSENPEGFRRAVVEFLQEKE
ncbi:alpha/beta-hydrolase [Aulographum hederae CBS 113979]|uniref:Alpha/beta-hydrolase n=1 Tax=Aulographum hederae CBS 113979 TaxID=1176131 RepID=A0A6G1GZ05_9PEZI|nr:alpha/beta-hydrolase [Aulographum hederae CBS 113979]